jgi:putative glutamine amidotransferase
VRPRIGITSGLGGPHWAPDGASWRNYAAAIQQAGAEPVHLAADTRGREAETLRGLQAIVFSGGNDIDLDQYPNPPEYPGESFESVMSRHRMRPEPERDAYEIPLLQTALQLDLPILGICRGCQVLNVALGGRLILDIPQEVDTQLRHTSHPAPDGDSSHHSLEVLPNTQLAGILRPEQFRACNSRHHQAVRVDETLTARIAAVSPDDGLIEAIEVPGRRWAIGVQWHPEYARDAEVKALYGPLFAAFVTAAS